LFHFKKEYNIIYCLCYVFYGETMNFNQKEQIDQLIKTIREKEIDVRPRPMFGLEKHLDRVVETLALSALMANNPSKKVEKRLRQIAFPLEIEL
jgi:hypothetical protein